MTRATIEPTTSGRAPAATRRAMLAGAAALSLVLPACGGGDDESSEDATTTTVVAAATTTAPAPTTTSPATTTTTIAEVEYVTEGAVVVVANASGINGAAGRLSERLAAVGYTMAEATNSADTVSNLPATQIYYDPDVEAAQAVAESLRLALGGGDIEVLEVAVPALTASGELGDANVLVLMGDDVADKSLDELQGRTTTTTEATDDTTDESTEDGETTEDGDTTDESTEDGETTDESTDG